MQISTSASPDFRHEVPADLSAALKSNSALKDKWDDLTDLARNEWICWTISVKAEKTRAKHLARLQKEILAGKRRPCCWPGCPHRRESARKWIDA